MGSRKAPFGILSPEFRFDSVEAGDFGSGPARKRIRNLQKRSPFHDISGTELRWRIPGARRGRASGKPLLPVSGDSTTKAPIARQPSLGPLICSVFNFRSSSAALYQPIFPPSRSPPRFDLIAPVRISLLYFPPLPLSLHIECPVKLQLYIFCSATHW